MQSTPSSTIDFSSYSNEQLENSLASINRDRFEQNYFACRAEIEKRKAEGRWKVVDAEAEAAKLQKTRKITRALALVQSIGGLIGIFNYAYNLGPALVRGDIPLITVAILVLVVGLLTLIVWAGWRYWKDQQDWKGLWRILICLQIPAFSISGLSYEFYSGFKIPLGLAAGKFGITAALGSNAAFMWSTQNAPFHFTINLGAIALITLLSRSTCVLEK